MRLKSHVSGVGHGRIRGCVSDTLAYVCARISHFLLFRKKKINRIPAGYGSDMEGYGNTLILLYLDEATQQNTLYHRPGRRTPHQIVGHLCCCAAGPLAGEQTLRRPPLYGRTAG
jgi:hypothetical protein